MISIIVPVYNAEKFIRESIQSVLDQTYTDFELPERPSTPRYPILSGI